MKRVTKRIEYDIELNNDYATNGVSCSIWDMMKRLAEYEDSGLTPHEVVEMSKGIQAEDDPGVWVHYKSRKKDYRDWFCSSCLKATRESTDYCPHYGKKMEFRLTKWIPNIYDL